MPQENTQSSVSPERQPPGIQDGRGWAWPAIYQLTLVVATMLALLTSQHLSLSERYWLITFVASSAIWHWLSIVETKPVLESRQDAIVTTISLAVLSVFWYLLILIHPAFYLLLLGLYSQILAFLPKRWALLFVFILSVVAATSAFKSGLLE
ncbi:MAG: hypothetical protein U9R25_16945 [Chloroflexota bacterium]|nr:hypothetical protein [Chloroflexota bacterium]